MTTVACIYSRMSMFDNDENIILPQMSQYNGYISGITMLRMHIQTIYKAIQIVIDFQGPQLLQFYRQGTFYRQDTHVQLLSWKKDCCCMKGYNEYDRKEDIAIAKGRDLNIVRKGPCHYQEGNLPLSGEGIQTLSGQGTAIIRKDTCHYQGKGPRHSQDRA